MIPANYDEYEKMVERGRAEFNQAVAAKADAWVPASGGTEVPFRGWDGGVYLYVFNPRTGQHAYLDCGTDMIVDDHEMQRRMPA